MADRCKKVYSQGMLSFTEMWVDTDTGVNYIWHQNGNSGGLTPLLGRDGKPVISYSLDKDDYYKE